VGKVFMGENKLISDQGKKVLATKGRYYICMKTWPYSTPGSSPYIVDNHILPQIPLEAK
jgi:hypothetical protein